MYVFVCLDACACMHACMCVCVCVCVCVWETFTRKNSSKKKQPKNYRTIEREKKLYKPFLPPKFCKIYNSHMNIVLNAVITIALYFLSTTISFEKFLNLIDY